MHWKMGSSDGAFFFLSTDASMLASHSPQMRTAPDFVFLPSGVSVALVVLVALFARGGLVRLVERVRR